MGRRLWLAAVLLFIMSRSNAWAQAAGPDGTATGTLARVTIGSTPGITVPPTFMGLSHEWHDSARMMGSSSTGVNTIYRQLLMNLTAYGSGPLNLRIGGDSTDGTRYRENVEPYAEVAKATGAHFSLGVNLGGGDVKLAIDQAKSYVKEMPPGSVDEIEVGNEPDLYYKNHHRAPNYSVTEYFADFDKWRDGIVPLLPAGTKLMGPSWCSEGWGRDAQNILDFATKESGAMRVVSYHDYTTNPGAKPAADFLLTPKAIRKSPPLIESAVKTAHEHGMLFRMGEFNSVGNAGVHGVSDDFAAALWSVDVMFEFIMRGVDGINWEASNGNFDNPFYFNISKNGTASSYTISSVAPLYYGLLMFQAATGHQARLLPVDTKTAASLKSWATVDNVGTPRLVLLNKDETQSGEVTVDLPGFTHASVLRLEAPSYKAMSGVTFGGYTFDGTTDGKMTKVAGVEGAEKVSGTNGTFRFHMPVTSGALVIFAK